MQTVLVLSNVPPALPEPVADAMPASEGDFLASFDEEGGAEVRVETVAEPVWPLTAVAPVIAWVTEGAVGAAGTTEAGAPETGALAIRSVPAAGEQVAIPGASATDGAVQVLMDQIPAIEGGTLEALPAVGPARPDVAASVRPGPGLAGLAQTTEPATVTPLREEVRPLPLDTSVRPLPLETPVRPLSSETSARPLPLETDGSRLAAESVAPDRPVDGAAPADGVPLGVRGQRRAEGDPEPAVTLSGLPQADGRRPTEGKGLDLQPLPDMAHAASDGRVSVRADGKEPAAVTAPVASGMPDWPEGPVPPSAADAKLTALARREPVALPPDAVPPPQGTDDHDSRATASAGMWERIFHVRALPDAAGPGNSAMPDSQPGLVAQADVARDGVAAPPSPPQASGPAPLAEARPGPATPSQGATGGAVPFAPAAGQDDGETLAARAAEEPLAAFVGPLSAHPGIAATGTTAATSALPVPQVAAQITAALAQSEGGVTELALSPEELGHVRLRLEHDRTHPDRMVVMITFERPETLDLFRRHAGELADALRAAGYSGADIGFGQEGGGANGFDRQPGQGAGPDRSDPPIPPPAPARPSVGASLDLRL